MGSHVEKWHPSLELAAGLSQDEIVALHAQAHADRESMGHGHMYYGMKPPSSPWFNPDRKD